MKKLLLLTFAVVSFLTTVNANEVNRWNDITMSAIRTSRITPPLSSRALAITHIAIFDAVNALDKSYQSYSRDLKVKNQNLIQELVVAAAARKALVSIFPTQRYLFEKSFADTVTKFQGNPAAVDSIALGEKSADLILKARKDDAQFMQPTLDFVATPGLGMWVPTMPTYENPLLPHWGSVKTFSVNSASQFRPMGPPALDSEAYKVAASEVQALGAKTSTARTAEQTDIAKFWSDGSGTNTPPGHYNVMARTLAASQNYSLVQTAHMLALLNIALADAAITCWDAKYAFWFWRPVTALRDTKVDSNWESLLFTPYFPEYVSGHSTFSGAADVVLRNLFGNNVEYSLVSDGLPGVTRKYTSITEATREAGRSRIYGGIHYEFSNQDGFRLGTLVGEHVYSQTLKKK